MVGGAADASVCFAGSPELLHELAGTAVHTQASAAVIWRRSDRISMSSPLRQRGAREHT
jgi:hypothetical protein